mmetsp:Transcript_17564/g.41694  ORF Transcript_17564/g.41694 Transcript_17564/m.41694 type:complete len:655 (-) Transcript_17564:80-2044(-)
MTQSSDDWVGSRQEALALNAREAQLLLQKLRSAEAALHDERQLSGREREVIVERLRFAESQDEAARERLARALSSLRTRAREGAAEAAAQHGHTEDCLVRLKEENVKLQASQASCHAQLQELREELVKSHRSKQEAVEDKSKLLEALTQLRSERAEEAKQLRVQQEQGAQLVQVTAERERLAGDAKKLQSECETRQRECRLLESTLESQRKAARYLEAQSEKEVRMLRHEMSECSASDLQRAEADAKEKDRLTKALAEAMERQQAPSNLLHELKRWNYQAREQDSMRQDIERIAAEVPGDMLLSELREARTRCRVLETALERRTAGQDEAHGQLTQDSDRARHELRKEMRSWLKGEADGKHSGEPRLQSPRLQSPAREDLERRCQDLQLQLDRALEDAAASRQRVADLEWDTRDATSSLWGQGRTPLPNRQASMELERTTVSLEAEVNAAFAQAQAAKAAEESALAALSESERRCHNGLRRMDAMLADTKELTRELAKHKHLAKGMDDLVRRHEKMLRQRDQDPLQATPTFSEVRSRSGRRPSPQARQPTVHPKWSVQEADKATSGRNELRADLHRTGGPDSRKAAALSLNSPSDAGRLRSGSLSPRERSKTQELRGSPYWRPLPVQPSSANFGSASRWREASCRSEDRLASGI